LVQYDQFVAERVANTRAPTYGDIKWLLDGHAACEQDGRESFVDIADQNVRLWADMQMHDQFRICLGQREASRFMAPPEQTMTELVSIEGDRCVEIADAKQMVVDLSK
jgi:hypothetical protein